MRFCLLSILAVCSSCFSQDGSLDRVSKPTEAKKNNIEKPAFDSLTLKGKVVWLGEALERLHKVKSVPESMQRVLALETPKGELHPLVEDIRGRAFRKDKRLRDIDIELLVRRHRGSPMIQVIRIYRLKKNGKFELDYWCDVCSIAMFEEKACECCQDPIRLRERLVSEKNTQPK